MAVQHSIFSKKESDLETFENNDRRRTCENVGMKTPLVCNESKTNKIYEKSIPPGGHELKTNDTEIIDLVNDSSPEVEPSPKKPSNEESKLTKMKKIITKGYKISRKSESSNSSSQSPESNEIKNKIKLRPRNSGKIYKSSSSEDIMAQDLDLGSSNIDNVSSLFLIYIFNYNINYFLCISICLNILPLIFLFTYHK